MARLTAFFSTNEIHRGNGKMSSLEINSVPFLDRRFLFLNLFIY